jgi:hypothetical protein
LRWKLKTLGEIVEENSVKVWEEACRSLENLVGFHGISFAIRWNGEVFLLEILSQRESFDGKTVRCSQKKLN